METESLFGDDSGKKMFNFFHDFYEGLFRSQTFAPFPRASTISVTGEFSLEEPSQDVLNISAWLRCTCSIS
jgi:hypothetical protein